MITHSVVFNLKHENNSAEEASFLSKARALALLPTVQNFKIYKQTSQGNPYTLALFMEFASQEDYDAYNNHPQHVEFVETIWLVEVKDFMELDYEALS